MKLREIMTPNPVVLAHSQSAWEAANLFAVNQVDGAPVKAEDGKVVGFFTNRHLCQMFSEGKDMLTPVEEMMTCEVYTAHPDDELEGVLNPRLERFHVVVVEDNEIVGIITRTDLLKPLYESYCNLTCELDTIINSTHNLIVSVNEEGNIKVFNKSAEKFLGKTADEVRGKNVVAEFPTSRLIDVSQSGKEEPVQKIKLNGRYYMSNRSPILKDGRIIGAVAVLQDISEVEKISKELRFVKELNEELDVIIESSFDGLYITDGNGITIRLNKAFEKMTGTESSDCLGRHVDDIIKEDAVVSESVSSLVLKQKAQVTIMQKTRSGKTNLATGTPVFDKQGNIFRVVCNVRDITELNMLKQELEKARGLTQRYEHELLTLRMQFAGFDKLVFNSTKMKDLLNVVFRLAQVDSTILITGESGTGKELIVETIHSNSSRKEGPLIKVNCGAIPENLLESELFGYEHGAFTGSKRQGKPGYFEMANGGILFLDEIGDLAFNLQVKLLRVIQSKEIVRVGGETPIELDVRIIAATNKNLMEMMHRKEFRADLYYRLNVVPVNVPPLRDRKEEIPALTAHFLQLFNLKYKQDKRISSEIVDIFMHYDWPGNVRELENLIERLVIIAPRDILNREDLPANLLGVIRANSVVSLSGILPLKEAVESLERQLLERAYAEFRTTREMAKELKIDSSTIVRKAAKYGISQEKPG